MDCSRQILHPRYTYLQYGTAVPAQLHGYRLYHFLPDPCNSYDMSVTQNERVNEREGEEKRNGGSEKAEDHRGNTESTLSANCK